MREAMLIIHFLGLTLGLGASFAFFFLGIARSRLEREESMKLAMNTSILSRMGHIGLGMLIISGFYLITPFWATLNARPMLIAKLFMVGFLTLTVIVLGVYSRKAKRGASASTLKMIAALGKVALLSGITIVFLAVLNFR
jgi:uncharacterized membrane protein